MSLGHQGGVCDPKNGFLLQFLDPLRKTFRGGILDFSECGVCQTQGPPPEMFAGAKKTIFGQF